MSNRKAGLGQLTLCGRWMKMHPGRCTHAQPVACPPVRLRGAALSVSTHSHSTAAIIHHSLGSSPSLSRLPFLPSSLPPSFHIPPRHRIEHTLPRHRHKQRHRHRPNHPHHITLTLHNGCCSDQSSTITLPTTDLLPTSLHRLDHDHTTTQQTTYLTTSLHSLTPLAGPRTRQVSA